MKTLKEAVNPQPISLCERCDKPNEWFMLEHPVWAACVENTNESILCIACVEVRLGQKLKLKHFSDAPINFGCMGFDCREYVKTNPSPYIAKS